MRKDVIAYIDTVGGVAGDMLLAALLRATHKDPEAFLGRLVEDLGLGNVSCSVEDVRRGGFAGTLIDVKALKGSRGPDWHSMEKLTTVLMRSRLPEPARQRAAAVLRRLAEAEARAHGRDLDHLHLHEAGDADAIVEIAGSILALHEAGIGSVICSPLPMGRGTVSCSHGLIPLPAPAVAEMLGGVPVRGVDVEAETVTPTGMALVREISGGNFGLMPPMTVDSLGVGAGGRDDGRIPNIVRVFVGARLEPALERETSERNVMIETNIDDMASNLFGHLPERLFESGALDVYVTPILMKKGRPAHKLSVLCETNKVEPLLAAVFSETTSTGMRLYEVEKRTIPRRNIEVDTPWGSVPVKVAELGGETVHVAPEFEACRKLAERHGLPVRRVMEEAASLARRKVGP
jgi:uncharacterized protein (TIGR00299 family) protein